MNTMISLARLVALGTTVGMLGACSGSSETSWPRKEPAEQSVVGKTAADASPGAPTKTPSTSPPAGGTSTPSGDDGTGGANGTDGAGGANGTDGANGQDGNVGRVSSGPHCCFDGKYLECPSAAACWGGFDVDACISGCADTDDACFDACIDKLGSASAPAGCQSKAAPAGVDCANGRIDL